MCITFQDVRNSENGQRCITNAYLPRKKSAQCAYIVEQSFARTDTTSNDDGVEIDTGLDDDGSSLC